MERLVISKNGPNLNAHSRSMVTTNTHLTQDDTNMYIISLKYMVNL